MTATIEEITAAALALTAKEKVRLLDRMSASIAIEVDPRIKMLQWDEVRPRRSQVLTSEVQGIASQQVRDEIAALLK